MCGVLRPLCFDWKGSEQTGAFTSQIQLIDKVGRTVNWKCIWPYFSDELVAVVLPDGELCIRTSGFVYTHTSSDGHKTEIQLFPDSKQACVRRNKDPWRFEHLEILGEFSILLSGQESDTETLVQLFGSVVREVAYHPDVRATLEQGTLRDAVQVLLPIVCRTVLEKAEEEKYSSIFRG